MLRSRPLQVVAGVTVVAYVVLLAYALLNPSQAVPTGSIGFVRDRLLAYGLPGQLGSWVESAMNALIFMPMPLLLYPLCGARTIRTWLAVGIVAASGVELVQLFLLPERAPQARDILANTGGAVVGALVLNLVLWIAALLQRGRNAV